jgi:hypothetical protein
VEAIAAQPVAFATAVAPVDANSTSKKASTLPREADSAPGGGGSTLSVGHSSLGHSFLRLSKVLEQERHSREPAI